MVKCCENKLCGCFVVVLFGLKLNGLKILKIILRNFLVHRRKKKNAVVQSVVKISSDDRFVPSVMKCFPCVGRSHSQGDITNSSARYSCNNRAGTSNSLVSNSGEKKHNNKARHRPRCPAKPTPPQSDKQPHHDATFSESSVTVSSRDESRRTFLWRTIKLLCICGSTNNTCAQLPTWGVRRDFYGRVPIPVDTPNVATINNMYNVYKNDHQICCDANSGMPCGEACDQNPEGDGGEDRLQDPSNYFSMETGGGPSHGRGETPWCKLLYWEENEIRSRVFNVWDPAINVLGDTPHGSGWSLSSFFTTPAKTEKISRVRAKICQGLILWREGKAVWVYNRSKTPVYLNSASLDGTFFNLNLYKCPPGYAMIIYYYEMARTLMGRADYKSRKKCDTTDVNSVRISFAKGWGKDYHRAHILCCPCWIEVHVVPTLKIEQRAPHR